MGTILAPLGNSKMGFNDILPSYSYTLGPKNLLLKVTHQCRFRLDLKKIVRKKSQFFSNRINEKTEEKTNKNPVKPTYFDAPLPREFD